MGIFWELLQQDKIEQQQAKSKDIEGRLEAIEQELRQTHLLLRKTLEALETHLSEDIDGDNVIGR